MNNGRKANKINRGDYYRILVTETLPYETPVIFSNDGLYIQLKHLDSACTARKELLTRLVFGFQEGNQCPSTIPYIYKINKTPTGLRRLSLLHPRAQWIIKEFYQKYSYLILYHCSHSPASIRAPKRIAGTYFVKNPIENLNQYKAGNVTQIDFDKISKYSPSYFAYRGYGRLHKFFESRDYFELEKQFGVMKTLDVSKCFDSIYTHTLSWAVKDKNFTKKHLSVDTTFAQEFDSVMRHSNHNETNGIAIGPEVSRIFSEIIFQKIDTLAINKLKTKKDLEFGNDYSFRRYVDDVYIFANSSHICKLVYDIYEDTLAHFSLHTNDSKSIELHRPFVTNKSRLIQEINSEVNGFLSKFLKTSIDNNSLEPQKINAPWKLTRSFIDSIKTICSHNDTNYNEIAGYLVGVFTERIKKLIAIKQINEPNDNEIKYRDAIIIILDIMFFIYQIAPSVTSSYKLCTSIVLTARFSSIHLPTYKDTIFQRIFDLTEQLLSKPSSSTEEIIDGFISLEDINIILGIRELGDGYLLPLSCLRKFFLTNTNTSYFGIISCLYYIRDDSRYAELKLLLLTTIEERLADLSDVRINTEKAYLLLDLLNCPYITDKQKSSWLRKALKAVQAPVLTKNEIQLYFHETTKPFAHVNWQELDLLNTLEKKSLKQAY